MTENPAQECPNCLSPLSDEGGVWTCPVCRFARRSCPACGGEMVKQVVAPEGLGIEHSGLPLEACEVLWICQSGDCGRRERADL